MQQRQNKTATESKKTSNISRMMLQRDKNRLKEQQKHAYIELLRAPRGKEYLRLLAESTEICKQLEAIEEQLKQLEKEVEQEAVMLPASDVIKEKEFSSELVPEAEEINSSWLTIKEEETTSSWPDTEVKEEKVPWLDVKRGPIDIAGSCEQKRKHMMQMQKRRDELAIQFKEAQKAFQEQLPVPEKLIGLIYPDWSIDILMKYGIIACPGSQFSSPEELIAQVQPRTQEEEKQWLKGNDAYETHFCEELLLVEIYMDVVCVVYQDGDVKVIE